MPNRFLLYVWLESADGHDGYDVIDVNVDLPPLTIATETEETKLHGVIFIQHELRKIEMEKQSPHGSLHVDLGRPSWPSKP